MKRNEVQPRPHRSTMTPYQRGELIRTVSLFEPIQDLAALTDPQLFEKWLVLAGYENTYLRERTDGEAKGIEKVGRL